jgi:hypothetical protein
MPEQRPITAFNALHPLIVRAIHEAFDDALEMLANDHDGPISDETRARISRILVEAARLGECNAVRMRDRALEAILDTRH